MADLAQKAQVQAPPRIAIVHDWLVCYAGAERVLEQLLLLFPDADLFAVCDFVPVCERAFLRGKKPFTTFIQRLPGARRHYRNYLPLMPWAIKQLDLSDYDLILSSSHSVAKGVHVDPGQRHLCLCYSPMRYAWDLQEQYLKTTGLARGIRSWLVRYLLHRLRTWDRHTAAGVGQFVAISEHIRDRILRVYGRTSQVVYPPVDTEHLTLVRSKQNFYVTASRLVPYKRVDLIVEAFSRLPKRQLVVLGDGPEARRIQERAGTNVKFLGHQPEKVLRKYLEDARAFLFAAEEDFGIVVLEAQACGTPVIAFGKGGALETVKDGETGLFFSEQTPESILEAIERFEQGGVRAGPEEIRRNSLRFSTARFRDEICTAIEQFMAMHGMSGVRPDEVSYSSTSEVQVTRQGQSETVAIPSQTGPRTELDLEH